MILAHLPAGYLVGRAMPAAPWVIPAAVLGGILPDFDLLAFYLWDDRAFHHHRYWVHIPGFWVLVAAITAPFISRAWKLPWLAFLTAIFVHIALDSIVGGIVWFWPFSDTMYTLIEVSARHQNWLLNFILHWTFFALELPIIMTAFYLWWRRDR
ncbi:MAG: metal-dependent hydrolase [Rhodobacteraceae bacterium]|nr:metal-dependent hydrolase [Paracoccaceae bacterium]